MLIKNLGQQNYLAIFKLMREFTDARTNETCDELWFLEHAPVFTQGQAGKPEHLLNPEAIPVIQTDRGGQVTYHGPGQLVAYTLFDINRMQLGTRTFVRKIEATIIDVLKEYGLEGKGSEAAPGVYINEAKIASIGLRIRKGCSYHGLAFNIAMDLEPFSRINPCGYKNMPVTQLAQFVPSVTVAEVQEKMLKYILQNFAT